jgi:dipeptide transport system ATP-binding protein
VVEPDQPGARGDALSTPEHRAGHGALVEVEHLTKHFSVKQGVFARGKGVVHAVEDVSLAVNRGETLGIVGESGCGKTTTARLIVRLIEPTGGTIRFDGVDITHKSRRDLRDLRQEMQIIFQDPYSSLNPRKSVGQIIAEPFAIHRTAKDSKRRVQALLERVGLNPEHYNRYPHEFSGGQRQRIGVARALALQPKLIVCDEPVSALDVSIQAQVLNLMMDLQQQTGVSYLFISHNLSVVEHIADEVLVMYLGKTVEHGTKEQVFSKPLHPYTRALFASTPRIDPAQRQQKMMLPGELPSPLNPPPGCAFNNRCPHATERCRTEVPLPQPFEGRMVACHRVAEI